MKLICLALLLAGCDLMEQFDDSGSDPENHRTFVVDCRGPADTTYTDSTGQTVQKRTCGEFPEVKPGALPKGGAGVTFRDGGAN